MIMSSGVFNRWMSTPKMEKIWRIMCIELYHDEPMKEFYEKFIGEALDFLEIELQHHDKAQAHQAL